MKSNMSLNSGSPLLIGTKECELGKQEMSKRALTEYLRESQKWLCGHRMLQRVLLGKWLEGTLDGGHSPGYVLQRWQYPLSRSGPWCSEADQRDSVTEKGKGVVCGGMKSHELCSPHGSWNRHFSPYWLECRSLLKTFLAHMWHFIQSILISPKISYLKSQAFWGFNNSYWIILHMQKMKSINFLKTAYIQPILWLRDRLLATF